MHGHRAKSRGERIPNLVGLYNLADLRRDVQAEIGAGWAGIAVGGCTKHDGTYAQKLCTGAVVES